MAPEARCTVCCEFLCQLVGPGIARDGHHRKHTFGRKTYHARTLPHAVLPIPQLPIHTTDNHGVMRLGLDGNMALLSRPSSKTEVSQRMSSNRLAACSEVCFIMILTKTEHS